MIKSSISVWILVESLWLRHNSTCLCFTTYLETETKHTLKKKHLIWGCFSVDPLYTNIFNINGETLWCSWQNLFPTDAPWVELFWPETYHIIRCWGWIPCLSLSVCGCVCVIFWRKEFSINHRSDQLAMDWVAVGRDSSLGMAVSLLKSFQDE